MAAAVESMAFAGEVPWHGLGVPVEDTMTPEEMLEAASLNWTVSKRPAYTIDAPTWNDDVGLLNAEGHHFIVRDTDFQTVERIMCLSKSLILFGSLKSLFPTAT